MARETVTMSDVARLADVSKMTVSNVVNDRPGVSEAVRRRVLEAVKQSGYRLNVTARTLKSGRTGVIGLAVPEVAQAYFGQLATYVIDQADLHGFHVAVEQTGAAASGELDAIAQSHRLQFDGLILSAVGIAPRDQQLPVGDFPIVMLGEQDFGQRFDHVLMPNEAGSKAATAHLVERGCRRIAIVTGASLDGVNVVSRRYRGYLDSLAEHGIEADPALVQSCAEMTMRAGRAAAHRLVDAGLAVDGVVAGTDTMALGVLRGLSDRGVRVPEDVRIIGFDDIAESGFSVPSLSTVAPDHAWMAAKSVELVIGRMSDLSRPAAEYIAPFAVVARESTR